MRNFMCGARPRVYRLGWFVGGTALTLASFAVGRLSASPHGAEPVTAALLVQNLDAPDDPRELIPLPGPGAQPGQPGEGAQPGECPVYLYQDGQLYELRPGEEGMPLPGQGQPGGLRPGRDGSPELFPLEPPAPRTPPRAPPRPSNPEPDNFPGLEVSLPSGMLKVANK